jgi:hypothetical protein
MDGGHFMKKYVTIYSFQVIEKIKEGNDVYCVDKGTHTITHLNAELVDSLMTIIKSAEKVGNYERYEFYYIESVKGEEKE